MRLAFVFDDHILQHEPLGPTYIASYVRQFGHDVEYFNIDDREHQDEIKKYAPDVLAYSVATGQQPRLMEINDQLREALPKIRMSVFGGPHPTFFPDMIRKPNVDAICIGEGEFPMGELLEALSKGDDYTGIENLHFKLGDGSIKKNKNRNFLPHLDDLPFPDHDIKSRFRHLYERRTGYFIGGRGCPFKCTFCFNDAMMTLQGGKYVRYRDPEKICEEIEMVKSKYDINLVSFQDDIFGIDIKWLEKFGPVYREKIKLPFMCHFRADMTTDRAIKAMYEAGCVRLIVGLESGDAELRQRVLDKRVSDEELLATSKRAHDHNIELLTQNMFGIPGETVDTAMSTVEMNIKIRPEVFIHYFFTPYPMTKLGKIAEEMDLFDGNFDDLPVTYHSVIPLKIPNKRQIELIGLNSYLFIDMPKFFYMTKAFFKVVKNEPIRIAWLKMMHGVDKLTKKLGMRKKTCWYHEPRLGWPFDDEGGQGGSPKAEQSEEALEQRRASSRLKSATGFGVAPNIQEVEKT